MKKSTIITSITAVALCGSTAFIAINHTATAKQNDDLVAVESAVKSPVTNISNNETVFVMADETGHEKSKFIGSTLYSGTAELPFTLKITYYLNGTEISTKDLANKSGHVKIVYDYTSTATHQGKFVPFVAVTGLNLDPAKFTNLKISNGKILNETSVNYFIAGYSIAGLNENLGTDLLPNSFTLEADTTDFTLKNTYTIFMNEILADFDTSKLNSLDGLRNSVNELMNGINQILSGATDLSNSLATALDGTKTIYAGSEKLTNGLNDLSSHNEELLAGAQQIAALAPDIAALMQDKIASLTTQREDLEEQLAQIPEAARSVEPYATYYAQLTSGIAEINAGIAEINTKASKLSELNTFYQGLVDYTDGVATAAAGSAELTTGLGSLIAGETKLYEGSITLKDGINTFKTSGIDKLVNFANQDLANFTANLRSSVAAAASYHSFGDTDAKSVKFIVKTPSI